MIKQRRWLIATTIGLMFCGIALVWYVSPNSQPFQLSPTQSLPTTYGAEPITPIPLTLQLDVRKVTLGRRLFFDARLSRDDTISCAHCHNLATGGTDGLAHDVGIGGKEGKINTLTVFNSGFNYRLLWDGRAATLEDQISFPLVHSAVMGTNWETVITKLSKDSTYRSEFSNIYPQGIHPDSITNAIATFVRSLITPNGKFDRFLRGDKQALDKDEMAGYQLFKNLGCSSCHQGMNVGGNMHEKLGVVNDYFTNRGNVQKVDLGRFNFTGLEEDRYEFRVPSLRNVALTAPYFHDASAGTLEEAVTIMGKFQLGINLNSDEVNQIVKFLNTLTGTYQGDTSK